MAIDTVAPVLAAIQRLTWHFAHDDSMAPVINLGDEFCFDPSELPADADLIDGAVYALDLGGEAMVRRVFMTANRVRLQPDSSDYAAIDLTPAEAEARGLSIAGRVVHREGRVF
jgi:phage repressor protein C with HTH and peptisase S24 domain